MPGLPKEKAMQNGCVNLKQSEATEVNVFGVVNEKAEYSWRRPAGHVLGTKHMFSTDTPVYASTK